MNKGPTIYISINYLIDKYSKYNCIEFKCPLNTHSETTKINFYITERILFNSMSKLFMNKGPTIYISINYLIDKYSKFNCIELKC